MNKNWFVWLIFIATFIASGFKRLFSIFSPFLFYSLVFLHYLVCFFSYKLVISMQILFEIKKDCSIFNPQANEQARTVSIVEMFDMNCYGMPTKQNSSESGSSRDTHSDIAYKEAVSVQKRLKIEPRCEYFISNKESNGSHQIDFIFILPRLPKNDKK